MAFNFNDYNDDILFVPLGGSNEIGMNLNLYTINGKWLMVDCGIGFALKTINKTGYITLVFAAALTITTWLYIWK